jgi:hypothetical protein
VNSSEPLTTCTTNSVLPACPMVGPESIISRAAGDSSLPLIFGRLPVSPARCLSGVITRARLARGSGARCRERPSCRDFASR